MTSRKKKPVESKPKEPEPRRDRKMVEIQQEFVPLIEQVRKRRALKTDTAVVNQAVRELLEREALWPPKETA